jgi:hypothetical protein
LQQKLENAGVGRLEIAKIAGIAVIASDRKAKELYH